MCTHRQLLGSFLDLLNLGIGETLDLEKSFRSCGDQSLHRISITSWG